MDNVHPDARLLDLGRQYEKYASDFDRLCENELLNLDEQVCEEDRMCEESRRLGEAFEECNATTWAGVAVYLRMILNLNRWGELSWEDRERQTGGGPDLYAWKIIAALPALIEQSNLLPQRGLTDSAS